MSIRAYKRNDKTTYNYNYKYWIDNFAKKEKWDDFIDVEYLNLVRVFEKQNNGKELEYGIYNISDATKLSDKHQNTYRFEKIDNEKLKETDYFKYNPQSFLDKTLLRILSIKQPTDKPKKKIAPFSRNELIGVVGIIIAFTMLALYIIVEKDNIKL